MNPVHGRRRKGFSLDPCCPERRGWYALALAKRYVEDREMLMRWRERRLYRRVMAGEVERVAHAVDEAGAAVRRAADQATKELTRLPGAAPRCRRCDALLQLARIPYKPYRARKTRWRTAYRCSRCGAEYRVAEARGTRPAAA